MLEKPTVPQYFLSKYYWPTVIELMPTGMSRDDMFDVAVSRFEDTEGFRLDMSRSTLGRHLREEAKSKQ